MKKVILAYCTFFTVHLATAQQNKELNDFNTYSQNMNTKVDKAINEKNYSLTVSILNEWLQRYNQLSPESKKSDAFYLPPVYYYKASFSAREGEKDTAILSFKKAVDLGYANYAETIADSSLYSLRDDRQFKAALQKMREKGDYTYILSQSGLYNKKNAGLPAFTYQAASDPNLVDFKSKFNLDSISGNGDEVSKLKNLLHWVHNVVRHDGNIGNPPSKNAVDLIAICKKENRGLNCRMLATILRDTYQAEGFYARIVTCKPRDTTDFDCHVITVVWSKTLNKWVWMDPTFNAYVSDDKGNLLNIEEVRQRLINGSSLVLNEDANWNNQEKQTKAHYLDYYMSKNLYWVQCSTKSEWDVETNKPGKSDIAYINLYPGKYSTIHQFKKVSADIIEYATNDADYFWQKPMK